ncbi:hypothetical protein PG989_011042 [Apiospora arundinis]|uniref:F-box domain-containing protein n=1 Tax=Apiospora arundinis TaxID=335852 RepID=A0ABR2HQE4_9PEZI
MRNTISLISIPNELLEQIFDAVQEQPALAAAARTCRALRDIAEAHLYSHLILEKPESLEYVEELMRARPQRAGLVQRLDLAFGIATYDEDLVKMTTADKVAALFPSLKFLLLESPRKQDRRGPNPPPFLSGRPADIELYKKMFKSASLLEEPSVKDSPFHNLTSLTLRWSGTDSRFEDITPAYPVFLLPNLERLEICSVIVRPIYDDLKVQEVLRFAGKTNLKTLIFTDSIVMPKALDLLLKVPKALERLELSESYIDAKTEKRLLRLSLSNLRHLILRLWRWRQPLYEEEPVRPRCLVDLTGLPSLETLQVGPHCDEMQYRWTLVGPLPPNLGFLRLTDFEVSSLLTPGVDSVLSDLRMGEVLSIRDGKRPSLVVDLSFFRFMFNRDHELDCKYNVRGLIRDLARKLRELQGANNNSRDNGSSSSPSPTLSSSAPYDGSGAQSGFDLGMTTVKPGLIQQLCLYHQKKPQRVVRYRYSHNLSRPDEEEFVARPYFDITGLPEDQANLEDQHADAIEWFAYEKLPESSTNMAP